MKVINQYKWKLKSFRLLNVMYPNYNQFQKMIRIKFKNLKIKIFPKLNN